jgi:hypothetical protein
MTLALVGGTHRTVPLALRERLAFTADQAAEALERFRDRFPGREGVLLSTCNRVEFYAAGEADAAAPPHDELVSFLAECWRRCWGGNATRPWRVTSSAWRPDSTAWCSASRRSWRR